MMKEVFNPLLNNKPAQKVMMIYAKAGYDIRFVGGCVRDCLSGAPVGDMDMATTATPTQGQEILQKAGVKTIPTGIDHGTITAVIDDVPFEITTLRRDVTTDGRRAVVDFTDDWLVDAQRRDFTINAMSLSMGGVLFDPFDGQSDLRAHLVRFIGDAGQRIEEDALRILRFFRFNAHIGAGDVDSAGLDACVKHAKLIKNLSVERIRVEVLKLLNGENAPPIWRMMLVYKINQYFLNKSNNINGINSLFNVKNEVVFDPIITLLSLFLPADRGQKSLQKTLRLSNKEGAQIANALTVYHSEQEPLPALLYYHGRQAVMDGTLLSYADGVIDKKQLMAVKAVVDYWKKPDFPINGDDLIERGYTQGKKMGDTLKELEKWWIENDFKPTRDACLARV